MKYLQKTFLFRFYSSRDNGEQMLLLCSAFSIGLVLFRIVYTGHLLFAFLVWNLFLAYVPYAISRRISLKPVKKGWCFLVVSLVWLLFIPNSFYILTDLFHLDMNETVPLWYDLALLLSFAWSGLLFGIVSLRHMEKLFEKTFHRKFDIFFIIPVMALNSFGVFVGRYLRFNSWDVLTSPLQLINDIIYLFVHPIRNRFDWSMIVCYTVLLTLFYYTIKKLSKTL
ncbi:MAG: DUF1361 domain-containing protein [Flavisolibacter sp.]